MQVRTAPPIFTPEINGMIWFLVLMLSGIGCAGLVYVKVKKVPETKSATDPLENVDSMNGTFLDGFRNFAPRMKKILVSPDHRDMINTLANLWLLPLVGYWLRRRTGSWRASFLWPVAVQLAGGLMWWSEASVTPARETFLARAGTTIS